MDMRHVNKLNPIIAEGHMDLFFLGEMIYDNDHCHDTIVDNNIHFYDLLDQSQVVFGESATTCIVNQMAKTDLLKLKIDSKKFNELFKVDGYNLTTSTIGEHIWIFEEKMGKNQPMKFNVEFKDFNI